MKRIFALICILIITFSCSGCFKKDDLEGATINTTVYPITYIANTLYGDSSNINSIYPNEADIKNYKLTQKQIDEYSKRRSYYLQGRWLC